MKYIGNRFKLGKNYIKVVQYTECDDCFFECEGCCLVCDDDDFECRKSLRDDDTAIMYVLEKFKYGS